MTTLRWRRTITPLLLTCFLVISGCADTPPSPYSQAQQESTQKGAPAAVSKEATQGSQFNQFFPKSGGGYDRVFTQEKKGFSEAKLKRGGKDLAMLSISDTISTPTAAKKFETSSTKVAGYPALEVGTTQSALLVNGRYQVKVLSRDPGFTPNDRKVWLQKFDLNGLSRLK